MNISIRDRDFEQSSIGILLTIAGNTTDSQRAYTLALTSDQEQQQIITQCQGTFLEDDLDRLCTEIEQALKQEIDSIFYAPIDPAFVLRGEIFPDESAELVWLVDHGMLKSQYSTDTGIAVVMHVETTTLEQMVAQLRA